MCLRTNYIKINNKINVSDGCLTFQRFFYSLPKAPSLWESPSNPMLQLNKKVKFTHERDVLNK